MILRLIRIQFLLLLLLLLLVGAAAFDTATFVVIACTFSTCCHRFFTFDILISNTRASSCSAGIFVAAAVDVDATMPVVILFSQ